MKFTGVIVVGVILGLLIWGVSLLAGLAPSVTQAEPTYPEPTNYVVDTTGTLDQQHIDTLNELLATLDKEAGRQIAVIIVPETGGLNIEEYSIKLAEKWKVGGTEDDGVMIVISMEEGNRAARIEVGYGAEGRIPDAEAGRILDNKIIPKFREGDFLGGILDGIQEINNQLNEEK